MQSDNGVINAVYYSLLTGYHSERVRKITNYLTTTGDTIRTSLIRFLISRKGKGVKNWIQCLFWRGKE